MRRYLVPTVLFLCLVACSPQGADFEVNITGAVNRNLEGATVYYEGTSSGRQLYIEKHGSGGDIQVLTIGLPAYVPPGTYTIATTGQVSAAYFEFVDGVSSQFERNVSGTAVIHEGDGAFSGEVNFYASAPYSQDSVQVVGSFNQIPYGAQGSSTGSLATPLLICGLVALLLINLVLQFYVGSKVYAGEGGSILRSLGGTRTFIRGWQLPEIRSIMLIWSLFLLLLILILGFLAIMAVSINA